MWKETLPGMFLRQVTLVLCQGYLKELLFLLPKCWVPVEGWLQKDLSRVSWLLERLFLAAQRPGLGCC